jgi:hypothetical protein
MAASFWRFLERIGGGTRGKRTAGRRLAPPLCLEVLEERAMLSGGPGPSGGSGGGSSGGPSGTALVGVSGPQYPLVPTSGPALTGSLLGQNLTTMPVSLPGSTVAMVPLLTSGGPGTSSGSTSVTLTTTTDPTAGATPITVVSLPSTSGGPGPSGSPTSAC